VSFDLVVLSGARDLDADEARDAYHELAAGADWAAVLGRDARIDQFVAALSARWPDIDTEVSPAHVILTMGFDAPDAVTAFCEATALGLGLNLFDPQDGTLYSPGKEPRRATPLPEKTLICEQCRELIAPGESHVESPRLLHLRCLLPGLQL
jgi:hypothetical protein